MQEDPMAPGRAAIEKELQLQAQTRGVAVSDILWKANRSDDHVLDFKVNGRRESIIFSQENVLEAPLPKGLDLIRSKVVHCLTITRAQGGDR